MPRRIRSSHPEHEQDVDLCGLPLGARLLHRDLPKHMDRDGRMPDIPRLIKGEVFPMDDEITADVIDGWLGLLAGIGRLTRYVGPDGRRYLQDRHWSKEQRPHIREAASVIPPPTPDDDRGSRDGARHGAEHCAEPCAQHEPREVSGTGSSTNGILDLVNGDLVDGAAPQHRAEHSAAQNRALPFVGLVQPPGRNVAVPGRVPLPATLFREFVTKVGGDENVARALVQSWAVNVLRGYDDSKPIAGSSDNFAFWRRRADESLFGRELTRAEQRRRGPQYDAPRPESTQRTLWDQVCAWLPLGPDDVGLLRDTKERTFDEATQTLVVTVPDDARARALQNLLPQITETLDSMKRSGVTVMFEARVARVSA